jgi:midasin (ATPase involved in ribosome maturation)
MLNYLFTYSLTSCLSLFLTCSAMLKTLAPLRPILFVGESGTAKTTVIQKYLDGLESSVSTKLNINFSSNTTAADVQTNIECNVDRRSGMTDV